ncbi:unnamed protein product [Effrenium voratum]|nr:unnamed protein product [Effrenium voratum]
MELRDAIIEFLGGRRSKESPSLEEISVQPAVMECMEKTLPQFITLEEWLYCRQRLNRKTSRLNTPQPLWTSSPERWRRDPPLSEPDAEVCPRFQRRDSGERRGSRVFGVNFRVTDRGQVFGSVAGDDETVCELPWARSVVVPEQKNFAWIQEVGAGTRRLLPSVTARVGGMVLEEVMAWRLSHRHRHRQVEPPLRSMWEALNERRPHKPCECEFCSGRLHYDISLADCDDG